MAIPRDKVWFQMGWNSFQFPFATQSNDLTGAMLAIKP
jgi:hypothetical protein